MRESSVEELLRGSDQQPAALGSGRRLLTGAEPPPALRTIRRLVAALVAVAAVALAALAVSVWQLVRGDATPTTQPPAEAPAAPRARASPPAAAEATEEATAPTQRARRATAMLVLHAARGDCWLEVRIGSRSGRIVHAGTLAQGRTLRVGAQRLWVAFGAGAHLDVTLNGERVSSFPSGTAAVVVTAGGVGEPRSV